MQVFSGGRFGVADFRCITELAKLFLEEVLLVTI